MALSAQPWVALPDAVDAKVTAAQLGVTGDMRGLAVLPNGNIAVGLEDDDAVIILDSTLSEVGRITGANTGDGTVDPYQVAASADGQIFVNGYAGTVERLGTAPTGTAASADAAVVTSALGSGNSRAIAVLGDWSAGTMVLLRGRGTVVDILTQAGPASDTFSVVSTITHGFTSEIEGIAMNAAQDTVYLLNNGGALKKFTGTVGGAWTQDGTFAPVSSFFRTGLAYSASADKFLATIDSASLQGIVVSLIGSNGENVEFKIYGPQVGNNGSGAPAYDPVNNIAYAVGGNQVLKFTPLSSVRTVDGVGGGAGLFATLGAAVADLAASPEATDGGKDLIKLTAGTLEGANVLIDHSVITDALEVDGNDNTAVFQASAVPAAGDALGVAMLIKADNASKTTVKDLVMVPEDDPSTGTVAFLGAAIRIKDQDVATTGGFNVALSGLTITSSTAGNAAVDPDVIPAVEDRTNWVFGASPIFAGGIRVDSTTGGAGNTVVITDTKISHTGSRGLYVAHKAGTTVESTNVETKGNTGVGLRTFSMTGDWILVDCVSTNNTDSAFATAGTSTAASSVTISGGDFSNNGFYGIQLDAAHTYSINGADGAPIRVVGNANRGVRGNNGGAVITGMSYMVIANNASHGFDVNELDTDLSWTNGINEIIFSGNGTISATPTNMSYGDTHSAAKTVEVSNVTFHNPSGAQAAGWEAFNFQHRFGSEQTWNFTDCIFAGNAGDSDIAIGISGTGANRVVNLVNSAVVTAGPQAVSALSGGTGSGATINQTAVINDDPVFVDAGDPSSANFLDVQASVYAGAGSAGSDLSGGADYTPTAADVTDWSILEQ